MAIETATSSPPPRIPGSNSLSEKLGCKDSHCKVWTQVPYDPSKYTNSHNAKAFQDWESTWDDTYPLSLIYTVGWARSSAPPGPQGSKYVVMYESKNHSKIIGTYAKVGEANNHAMAYFDQCTPQASLADLDGCGFAWHLRPDSCLEMELCEGEALHKVFVLEKS